VTEILHRVGRSKVRAAAAESRLCDMQGGTQRQEKLENNPLRIVFYQINRKGV
jgi:hypothetical protein